MAQSKGCGYIPSGLTVQSKTSSGLGVVVWLGGVVVGGGGVAVVAVGSVGPGVVVVEVVVTPVVVVGAVPSRLIIQIESVLI